RPELLPLLERYASVRPFSAMVPISALREDGVGILLDEIAAVLPHRGPAYDDDFLTDRPMRFFASEFVREQVILATKQEIPHSVAVTIDRYEEGEKVTHIDATVWCTREGQRKIIIGKNGELIKAVGIAARERIEALVGRQVHLTLWVTIESGWLDSAKALDSLGYTVESAESEEVRL
ncbi:MAG: GTPase Era, partial [Polyangiaceae bacterium]|nr:GTPase Era [Polyangiaceae bacterium]